MAESLGSAVLTLGVDATSFETGLQQAKNVAAKQGTVIGNTFAGQISGALATFGLGVSAVGFLKQSIDAATELETITRKLSNTLGEQGAARALAQTRTLSDQLGLSFTTLAGTFGSFTAAASAAGTPLKVQEDLFASVAKAAQSLGLSNDELSGSLLALQQIASKGTVQMEELRGQLGERLPIAFGAAAKGLGLTQQELIKLVETGRLTSAEFFPALTKGLNELTAASTGAPTAAQNFQQLANAWKDLQTAFGQNLLPQVIEGVKLLRGIIDVQGSKITADRLGFGTGAIGAFGIFKQEALDSVAVLKQVQTQLSLTDKQATALFFDAQKSVGVKNIGLASPEQVEEVLVKYRELAKLFREKYPSRQAEAEALSASSAAALAADKARLNTVTKISDKIKEIQSKRNGLDIDSSAYEEAGKQLSELKKKLDEASRDPIQFRANTTLFLQQSGLALDNLDRQIAKAKELAAIDNQSQRGQLSAVNGVLESIQNARDQQQQLAFQLQNQTATGAPQEQIRATLVDAEKAGKNVELALINGGRQLRDFLLDASKQFTNALTGNFDILNESGKRIVLDEAQKRVVAGIQTGLIDPTKIPSQQDAQAFIRFSQQAGAVADASTALQTAQQAVANASAQLVTVNTSLNNNVAALFGVNNQLLQATSVLAQKDWGVNVSVFADGTSQAYGDVVNRAI